MLFLQTAREQLLGYRHVSYLRGSIDGYVRIDDDGETSVAGVYAAGDLTPGIQLVQVAAAQGTVAGIGAALSLQGEPGSPLSPPAAPDGPREVEEAAPRN